MVKEIKQFNPNFQRQILSSLSVMLEPTALPEVLLHSFQNVQAPTQWGLLHMKATQFPITPCTFCSWFSYPFSISPQQTFPEQLCSLLFNTLHSRSQVQLGPQWICYDSKASNTRWWPIASSFSLTDVQATSKALAEPSWLLCWNDTFVLEISLETLNMVQTVTPAQRKKGKKMVNTLKLELCNLI